MPRPKATDVGDVAVEDLYLSLLGSVIENYKKLIASDHPDADHLVGEYTKLFQLARRQHGLITGIRNKREGSK